MYTDRRVLVSLQVAGKKWHALIGATPEGLDARLIRLQLRKPLDTIWCQGANLPNVNLLPLYLSGSELQILSWKGQGICFDFSGRLRMGPTISNFAKQNVIVCF